jgi:hypothetical protein
MYLRAMEPWQITYSRANRGRYLDCIDTITDVTDTENLEW